MEHRISGFTEILRFMGSNKRHVFVCWTLKGGVGFESEKNR